MEDVAPGLHEQRCRRNGQRKDRQALRAAREGVTSAVKTLPYALAALHERRVVIILLLRMMVLV
jgi:hypothetical protein